MLQPLTLYKCLADDTRLKSLLLIALNDSLCVCDLQHALQLSQPKVSRHLARRGKWVYYRLADNLPNWARQVLLSTADHNHDYLQPCVDLLAPCCAPKTV
jgi:ArsR family transcriptional regulator